MKNRDLSVRRPKGSEKRQCTAHRKNGDRCKKPPILGGSVCEVHGGRAPQVREAARRRLLAAADWLIADLLKIAKSSESDGVKLAAINSALDRAGFGAKQELYVEAKVSPWDEMFNDTDGDPVVTVAADTGDEDEPQDDDEPDALTAPAVRRAIKAAPSPKVDGEPLEGVIVDSPRPNGAGSLPRHIRDALRRSGYDI